MRSASTTSANVAPTGSPWSTASAPSSVTTTDTSPGDRHTATAGAFRLRIDRGPTDAGREVHFHRRRVTVGRADGNDLILRWEKVSKTHFTIHWDDELRGFVIADNGSKNGVNVNGRRVVGNRLLAGGDRIEVVGYELVFHAD